jgi:hypothetical protein
VVSKQGTRLKQQIARQAKEVADKLQLYAKVLPYSRASPARAVPILEAVLKGDFCWLNEYDLGE